MLAMLSLIHGAQMVLGWTWRTMLHGEEQFFNGLLAHDGGPNPALEEYRQIACDFTKLSGQGFPLHRKPEIAVAFNQENQWIVQYHPVQFRQAYSAAIIESQRALFDENRDYNMVRLEDMRRNYRLLIIPDGIIMNEAAADAVREYVSQGGTVWMTGYSAMLNGGIGAFDTPRPGLLSDVFGLRVAGFDRAGEPDEHGNTIQKTRRLSVDGETVFIDTDYSEHIELRGAEAFAIYDNGECAVSAHRYGKGAAYYLASQSNADLFRWMLKRLSGQMGTAEVSKVPEGVVVRRMDARRVFYLNLTGRDVIIPMEHPGVGLLEASSHDTCLKLAPYGYEMICPI